MPSATTPDANLPIFDFSRFRKGDQQERKAVSKEIIQAFKTFGFVYIINHGISQEKIKDLFYWVISPFPCFLCARSQEDPSYPWHIVLDKGLCM